MFKIGDLVMAIDDDVQGKVIDITPNEVKIVSTEGFEIAYQPKELVLDRSKDENLNFGANFSALAHENTHYKRNPKTAPVKRKEKQIPAMEVDLHIHKLVHKTKGLSNHDMLNIQMQTAKSQLDFAISKRIQRIVFIHGVGQGVLKAELAYLFRSYEHIEIKEADYRKYGLGAMEIYINQRAFS